MSLVFSEWPAGLDHRESSFFYIVMEKRGKIHWTHVYENLTNGVGEMTRENRPRLPLQLKLKKRIASTKKTVVWV